jgi:hypothetical protein
VTEKLITYVCTFSSFFNIVNVWYRNVIFAGIVIIFYSFIYTSKGTADGVTVVKVLRYKSEGRWFDSRWCHWIFPLT